MTANARVATSTMGVMAAAGIQWEAAPLVTLGLTVRSPELAIRSSAEGGGVLAIGSAGGTDPPTANVQVTSPPSVNTTGLIVAPTRILAGIAWALGPPESYVELGVDGAHGLAATPVTPAMRPTFNVRVGARYRLSPSWIVGGGLFTDRSFIRELGTSIGEDRVDYYGMTLGVSKRTPLGLVQDPSPEALVLVTTISLRAAAGFGQARVLTIDGDNSAAPRDDRSDVAFYEVMPYLGSSILF